MIQHNVFPDGGFVLHKIMINNKKYSAWYDNTGKLLDAERFAQNNQSTTAVSLTRHKKIVAELTKIGKRYVTPTVTV